MAKAGQGAQVGGLEGIAAALPRESRGLPPVELWNPPFCGDIDMRISTDGTWFYQKTPIGRPALVKLFASILKREGDKYFLVTPVEKVGVVVEDVPLSPGQLHQRPYPGSEHLRTGEDELGGDLEPALNLLFGKRPPH